MLSGAGSTGPLEQLIDLNRSVLEARARIRMAKLHWRLIWCLSLLAVGILASTYVATAATWRKVDLSIVDVPAVFIFAGCIVGVTALANRLTEGGYVSLPELGLRLDVAEERRRLYAASLSLSLDVQRFAYRDSTPAYVDDVRVSSKRYRRVHNWFQAIIIIGSLGTTTLAGLESYYPALRWGTIGLSFSVGISAGFTGYFKFRERSFYLQQTADSIEQEFSSVQLRIGPYSGASDDEVLRIFAERVENLKDEQRKREQQLDQPSQRRDGASSV